MLLQVLHEYAQDAGLIDEIESARRTVHLCLVLHPDGTVDPVAPWRRLSTEVSDARGKTKIVPGLSFDKMPRFPGENNGGKAHFLADGSVAVLGLDPKEGRPLPDDPREGKNATKSFLHFWQRIQDAHDATGHEGLATLLAFRDRYLGDANARQDFPFVGIRTVGKKNPAPALCALTDDDPLPLKGLVLSFDVDGQPIFRLDRDHQLHAYWKTTYAREAFSEGDAQDGEPGLCLINGEADGPIASSHKPEIKGVPGLPPKGGYLVSFAREAPALSSYGFEGTRNAPVSEQAAAAYALALNDLLADDACRRRINDFVLCSWLRDGLEDMSYQVNKTVLETTPEDIRKFFETVEKGRSASAPHLPHFRSLTLASNGGRVVVRRWLDMPLPEAADRLKDWFHDLELDVPWPVKKGQSDYRAMIVLASATARTPGDVRAEVYDALYRAAFEGSNPSALLPSALRQLRMATIRSRGQAHFQAERFALIKLILNRVEPRVMTIEPSLCQTNDAPYNCGRLLAVLDDLQYAAHRGEVGADVVARYYGNASSYPGNVLPRLLRLGQAHLSKLSKGTDSDRAAAAALRRKLNDISALFTPGPSGAPEYPGLLNVNQQGRFALGFFQQKAADQRVRDDRRASKKAATAEVNEAE